MLKKAKEEKKPGGSGKEKKSKEEQPAPQLQKQASILYTAINKMVTTPSHIIEIHCAQEPLIVPKVDKGNKIKPDKELSEKKTKKAMCKYGDKCYRTNPEHLAKYDHPHLNSKPSAKDDSSVKPLHVEKKKTGSSKEEEEDKGKVKVKKSSKMACKYGLACYNTNPQHREKYFHADGETDKDSLKRKPEEDIDNSKLKQQKVPSLDD